MLDEFFGLFGTHPKFEQGQLVSIHDDSTNRVPRYMAIEKRRWLTPTNGTKRQWVYDGAIFMVVAEKLVYSKHGSCYPESDLKMIPGSAHRGITHSRNFKSSW
jgi:hypothetical protein